MINIFRKSAFTILELIIVVIIIAVISSLAIPRMSNMIEHSRATEALNMISMIRGNVERCYVAPRSYSACNSWDEISLTDPGTSVNSHFTYSLTASANNYTVLARRNTYELIGSNSGAVGYQCPGDLPQLTLGTIGAIVFCSQIGAIVGGGIYRDL